MKLKFKVQPYQTNAVASVINRLEGQTTDFLGTAGHACREDIDRLLLEKLSDVLDIDQKKNKVANLLTKLRRSGAICNTGSRTAPRWVINCQAVSLQKERCVLQKEIFLKVTLNQ